MLMLMCIVDSGSLAVAKIATEIIAIEITPFITYVGVVFSFMGLLSSDRYHFDFMISMETLTFLLISNLVVQ